MEVWWKIGAVVALALLLVGSVLKSLSGCVSRTATPLERTQAEMSQLSLALQLYRREYGIAPDSTDNAKLIAVLSKENPRKLSFYSLSPGRNPDGVLLDGWGRPFVFEKTETGFLIRSAGKDGVLDTKDDLETTVPPPPPTPR